jgi:hypothetical protein
MRFAGNDAGSYVVIAGLSMPIIIGSVSLGTEIGLWYYKRQSMQSAADSAALSAATSAALGETNLTLQATAVAAAYGFIPGTNGVTIAVNKPPLSGDNKTTTGALEVILKGPQQRFFSQLFDSRTLTVAARSVAVSGQPGCVLALSGSASGAVNLQGTSTVTLKNCALFDDSSSSSGLNVGGSASLSAMFAAVVGGVSGSSNITTTMGVKTGAVAAYDPYTNASFPTFSGCDHHNYTSSATETIQPGVYCGGMTFKAGANVTLSPGIYYLDRGGFQAAGQSSIQGTGVTLIFTSSTGSNFADATSTGGAAINLTAPTTGPTAGIVIFGDRNMPVSTSFKFAGNGSQVFGGAVYLPKGALSFSGGSGGSNNCTQIIADTINFVGTSDLAINCGSYATKSLGSNLAALVE